MDIPLNDASFTTSGTSGTDAPAAGTSETWDVSALSSAWPTLYYNQWVAVQDPAAPSELIWVTACKGAGATSITVTRGAEHTTPVAHASGATFAAVLTAGLRRGIFGAFGEPNTFASVMSRP